MEELKNVDKKARDEVVYNANGQEVRLTSNMVKKYLTRGTKQATDQEAIMFLSLCKYQKLNPFLNEAYLVKFGQEAQIVVGKEAFFKRAENDPNYNGYEAGIIVLRKDEILELEGSFKLKTDELVGGWAKVYRKDRQAPSVAKVSVEEYNKNQAEWKTKPCTMIRKVALVQALREAFPESLGAMYTSEETVVEKEDPKQEVKENANKETLDFEEPVVDVEVTEVQEPKPQETKDKVEEGLGF